MTLNKLYTKIEKKEEYDNFDQLTQEFPNNNQCRKYLEKVRWNNNPICHHCMHKKSYKFKDGRTYKCAKCRKKYSVTLGTIMENTKIPLNKWFWAMYLQSPVKRTSSSQLARDIYVTQKTAWYMLQKIENEMKKMGLKARKDLKKYGKTSTFDEFKKEIELRSKELK